MEIAPALLPAGVDGVCPDRAERSPETLLPTRVGVGHELDAVREVTLLEAFREELEHQRPRALRTLWRDDRRDAAQRGQRNALFSFSKNPSSSP